MKDKINSEIQVKATAALDEEIKKELEVQDPAMDRAKALLKENEITNGDDGKGRS